MYVTSFLDSIGGGGAWGRCSGCLRDKEEPSGVDSEKAVDSARPKNVAVAGGGDPGSRRIDIMPGQLVSCTNSKLVSSSKFLNADN